MNRLSVVNKTSKEHPKLDFTGLETYISQSGSLFYKNFEKKGFEQVSSPVITVEKGPISSISDFSDYVNKTWDEIYDTAKQRHEGQYGNIYFDNDFMTVAKRYNNDSRKDIIISSESVWKAPEKFKGVEFTLRQEFELVIDYTLTKSNIRGGLYSRSTVINKVTGASAETSKHPTKVVDYKPLTNLGDKGVREYITKRNTEFLKKIFKEWLPIVSNPELSGITYDDLLDQLPSLFVAYLRRSFKKEAAGDINYSIVTKSGVRYEDAKIKKEVIKGEKKDIINLMIPMQNEPSRGYNGYGTGNFDIDAYIRIELIKGKKATTVKVYNLASILRFKLDYTLIKTVESRLPSKTHSLEWTIDNNNPSSIPSVFMQLKKGVGFYRPNYLNKWFESTYQFYLNEDRLREKYGSKEYRPPKDKVKFEIKNIGY